MGMDDIKKLFGGVASTTAKKASEQIQITKIGIEKAGIDKQIEEAYVAIGKRCMAHYKAGDTIPEEILDYCKDIDSLMAQLAEMKEKMEQHRQVRDDSKYQFSTSGDKSEEDTDDILVYEASFDEVEESDETEENQ